MNLLIEQKALCEELGIRIKEEAGEYVLTIQDAEILRGNENDLFNYLERMVVAQNTISQEKMGNLIKNLREENNISISDFAYSIFKTPEELELIESGRIKPDKATLNLIGNMFGVSSSALEAGELKELRTRRDIRDLLKNIEELLLEIKHDNAEMREFIHKWNLTEEYEQKKEERAEVKIEEQYTDDVKTADESLSRYTVVPKSATLHTMGKEMSDGYYVVVDTYTGEVVMDEDGMERQFVTEAEALAYATILEKQTEKMVEEEVVDELPEPLEESEMEKELSEMKMKM